MDDAEQDQNGVLFVPGPGFRPCNPAQIMRYTTSKPSRLVRRGSVPSRGLTKASIGAAAAAPSPAEHHPGLASCARCLPAPHPLIGIRERLSAAHYPKVHRRKAAAISAADRCFQSADCCFFGLPFLSVLCSSRCKSWRRDGRTIWKEIYVAMWVLASRDEQRIFKLPRRALRRRDAHCCETLLPAERKKR